ncbi:hypothetical protein ACJJTC_013585 [Scirpophaga incertulas]
MTYVSLHETINTTIEAKRQLYKKLTLKSYLRGLKEPLGSRIRCMRPQSIEQALEFVQEEMNTMSFKTLPNAATYAAVEAYPSSATTLPWTITHSTNVQSVTRPNYNPQSNIFRMPNRNPPSNMNLQGPKPMSGVSHYVTKPLPPSGHDWRKFGNPPPSNYFKTREVNFNDCSDYEYGPYFNYSDYYYSEPVYNDDTEYTNYNCNEYSYYEYPQHFNEECSNVNLEPCKSNTNTNINNTEGEDFQYPSQSEKPK